MAIAVGKIFKVILLVFLSIFVFLAAIYSWFIQVDDFFFLLLFYGFFYLVFSFFISFFYILKSFNKKRIDIFCFYLIPVLVSGFIFVLSARYNTTKWDDEMLQIAQKVESYYNVNGIKSLSKQELFELGINEEVYITVNDDKTYFIVNKKKNIVYRSDINKIVEEDSDY